jgi:hypothetical protein
MSKNPYNFKSKDLALSLTGWLLLSALAPAANSISHRGITWTFAADHPSGTFANGEPWVVGPLTITNIDPNPSQSTLGTQHGSMINPVPKTDFGFDSSPKIYPLKYDPAKNVALSFPFALNPGDVLVSARSRGEYPTWLQTICALTVLGQAPPAGSFRPGIFGADRTVRWNISQIDWSLLKNYTRVPSTPGKADIQQYMPPLPWFEWNGSWDGNALQPRDNTADGAREYGREIAGKFGCVGLWLNTNQTVADKQPVAIQMIQNGIDIHNYLTHGGGFYHDGGHKCGRKLPLVIAAMLLNDASLKAMAGNPDIFQEDTQTWIVTQNDVGRQLDPWPGNVVETYAQEHVGMAEWGIRHRFEPNQDNRSWSATYRDVVGTGMMGPWLAATLMGAQATWNHPAAFAYMERWKNLSGFGGATYGQRIFNQEMWQTHKNAVPQPPNNAPSVPQGLRVVE